MADRANIIVTDGGKRNTYVCLPGVHLLDHLTLCGSVWPDSYEHTTRKADCAGCLAVIDRVAEIQRDEYIRRRKPRRA